jgi:hypothetical protein
VLALEKENQFKNNKTNHALGKLAHTSGRSRVPYKKEKMDL